MLKHWKKILVALAIALIPAFAYAYPVTPGFGGGTGISTTTAGNVNKCLTVSSSSPYLLWTIGACGSGGGSSTTFNGLTTSTLTVIGSASVTVVSSTDSNGGQVLTLTASGGSGSSTNVYGISPISVAQVGVNATVTFLTNVALNWGATQTFQSSTIFQIATNTLLSADTTGKLQTTTFGGTGLTFSGNTLTWTNPGYVLNSRQILSGGILSGGGDLTADRTISFSTSTLYSEFSGSAPISFNTSTGAISWSNTPGFVTAASSVTWTAAQTFNAAANFNATATFNSSTVLSNVTSSLVLTDSTGKLTVYAGGDCSSGGKAIQILSASGTVTCVSVGGSGGGVGTSSPVTAGLFATFVNGSTITGTSSYVSAITSGNNLTSNTNATGSVTINFINPGFVTSASSVTWTAAQIFNSTATFNSSTIFAVATNTLLSADSNGKVQSTTLSGATFSGNTLTISAPSTTIPTGANPSTNVDLSTHNGTANTFMRSDAAPALSQSIAPTWTALHTFTGGATFNSTATFNSSTIIANVTSSILATDSTGKIVATTTSAGGGSGNGNLFVTPTSSVAAKNVPYYTTAGSSTVSATSGLYAFTTGDVAVNSSTDNGLLSVVNASATVALKISTTTGATSSAVSFNVLGNVSSSPTAPINIFQILSSGHVNATGTKPTASSCGTNPAVVGTDMWGSASWTGAATTCKITFQVPYESSNLFPIVSDSSSTDAVEVTSVSSSSFTATFAASLSGGTIYWLVGQSF